MNILDYNGLKILKDNITNNFLQKGSNITIGTINENNKGYKTTITKSYIELLDSTQNDGSEYIRIFSHGIFASPSGSIGSVNIEGFNTISAESFKEDNEFLYQRYLSLDGGTITGDLTINGTITGDGSGITNINAATLDGHSASYFQPAMFQYINNLLNVSERTIYYCDSYTGKTPFSYGLTNASAGICISGYLNDGTTSYITLVYIPLGDSQVFTTRFNNGATELSWKKINDGGNAATVGGKTVSQLQNYNNLTNKPTSLPANGGNADTVDGKHAEDFTQYKVFKNTDDVLNERFVGLFKIEGGGDITGFSLLTNTVEHEVNYDGLPLTLTDEEYIRVFTSEDLLYKIHSTAVASNEEGRIVYSWEHSQSEYFEFQGHKHKKADITDFPTTLPANGGNADTVGGKSISDLFIKTSQYIRIEETDFNTITAMGAYTIGTDNGSLMTESKNQPVGAYQWGTMVVFVSGGYGSVQMYFAHSGDVWIRGTFNSDFSQWNPWVKMSSSSSGTVDTSLFYKQLNSYGMNTSDSPIEVKTGYNKIMGGIIDFDTSQKWGMNINKETDSDSNLGPSLFVSEYGREAYTYKMFQNGVNTFNSERRTLSIGGSATVVIAASNTYPDDLKFSADYICTGSNDQSKINNAIRSLSDSQGGKIILLNGTYNITESIDIYRPNVTIEGIGKSTVLSVTHTSSFTSLTLFRINGNLVSNIEIKNLQFNMSSSGSTSFKSYFIYIYNELSGLLIDNIEGASTGECNLIGFNTGACISDSIISNCKMECSDYSRIRLNGCGAVKIINNTFHSALQCPLYITNSDSVILSNNIIKSGNSEKFYFTSNTNSVCSNNIIKNDINETSTTNSIVANNVLY